MKRMTMYISVFSVAFVALAAKPPFSLRDEKEPLSVLHADGFGPPPIILFNRVKKLIYFVETDPAKTNTVVFIKALIPESSIVVQDSQGEFTVRILTNEFWKIELDRIKPRNDQQKEAFIVP